MSVYIPGQNPYENRWRWWYPAISDWMIRNPGKPLQDCASELSKHPNTIYMIAQTDMFKEFHAQRLEEWRKVHDFGLRARLTQVAEGALDIMLEQIEKKGDQIPMKMAAEFATSALDRLGYLPSAQGPAVQVNVNNQHNNTVVLAGVSATQLEEARMAMRLAEESRRGTSNKALSGPEGTAASLFEGLIVEAEPAQDLVSPESSEEVQE